MNDQFKENDILVSSILNPSATTLDLVLNGMNVDNTMLLTPEAYKSMPFVLKTYTNLDGIFDNDRFLKDYKKAQDLYSQLSDIGVIDSLDNFVAYDKGSIYAPDNAPQLDNTFKIEKTKNPYRTNEGLKSLYGIGESGLSIRELAQQSKIWDTEKGEWMDKTANELGFFGGLAASSLVYATWDEDGYHVDPETGRLVKHKKGDYKLNQDGEFYTETLGNRESYGKEFVALSDVLTKEGTTLNKFDFFDSDGINKSIGGIVAKNAFKILPYFIPVVGQALGTASMAFSMAGSMPTLLKGVEGIAMGEKDNALRRGLTKWENYFGRFNLSSSDHAKEHPWAIENIATMVSDSVELMRLMLGVAMCVQALKKVPTNAKAYDHFINKFNLSVLINPEIAGKLNADTFKSALTKAFNASPEMKAYSNMINKLSSRISLGAMSVLQAKDVYSDALLGGYDRRTAGLALYAALVGLYAIMINEDKIGDWFLGSIGEYNPATDKTVLSKMLMGHMDEIKDSLKKIEAAPTKEAKTKSLATILNKTKDWIYDFWHKEFVPGSAKAFWINSGREATEEVLEELVNDAVKGSFDVMASLGFGKNKQASFGVKEDWVSGNAFLRYLQNFVGGAIGGAVFQGMEHGEKWLQAKLTGELAEDTRYNMIQAIRDGRADEMRQYINKWAETDKHVLNFPIGVNGNDGPVTAMQNVPTRGEVVKQRMLDMIDYLENTLSEADVNADSDTLFERIVTDELLSLDLLDLKLDKLVKSDLDNLINNYVKAKADYDALNPQEDKKDKKESDDKDSKKKESSTDNKKIQEAKNRLDKAKEELDNLLKGSKAKDYLIATLLYGKERHRQAIIGSSFNFYLTANYGTATLQEIEQKYGLTVLQLTDEYNEWKKKVDDPSLVLRVASLYEKEIRLPISKAGKEYVESKYSDVRLETYDNILSQLISGNMENIMDKNDEQTENVFLFSTYLHNKSKGATNISFSYLIKLDPEIIDKFLDPILDSITPKISKLIGITDELTKQNLKKTISEAIQSLPINVYTALSIRNIIILAIAQELNTVKVEDFFEANSTYDSVNKKLQPIFNDGYNANLSKIAIDLTDLLDSTKPVNATSLPAIISLIKYNKLIQDTISVDEKQTIVSFLSENEMALSEGDITDKDFKDKLLANNTIVGILTKIKDKCIEATTKILSGAEIQQIFSSKFASLLNGISINNFDVRYSILNNVLDKSDTIDAEMLYEWKKQYRKSLLNLVPTLLNILKSSSISDALQNSIVSEYITDVEHLDNALPNLLDKVLRAGASQTTIDAINNIILSYRVLEDILHKMSSKTIKKNPLLGVMRNLDQRIGVDGNVSKLLDAYESALKEVESSLNITSFELTANKRLAIEDIAFIIELIKVALEDSVRSDIPAYEDMYRYSQALNRFETSHGLDKTTFDLDIKDAYLLATDLMLLQDSLKAMINLSDRQTDIKLRLNKQQSLAYAKAFVDKLISKNIKVNGLVCIPPDVPRDEEHYEEIMIKTGININKLMSDLKKSDPEKYQLEFTRLVSEFAPKSHLAMQINQMQSSTITENMNISDIDMLHFLVSSIAEDPGAYLSRLKAHLGQSETVFPFATLEIAARYVSAYISNKAVFELASDILIKTLGINDKLIYQFANFMRIPGTTGAGKTSLVTVLGLIRSKKVNTYCFAPSTTQAETLLKAIQKDSNVVGASSIHTLLKAGLGTTKYELMQDDLKLTKQTTSKVKTGKFNQENNNGGIIGTFKTSDINVEAVRSVLQNANVILIDEETNLSSLEKLALATIVKALEEEDNVIIPVLLIGDPFLIGNEAVDGVASGNGVISWNTPILTVSVRANNTALRININNLRSFLSDALEVAVKNGLVNPASAAMPLTTFSLNYFLNENTLEGCKILTNKDTSVLVQEYARIKSINDNYNALYGTNEKVMVIALVNSEGKISDDLHSILTSAGFTESDYVVKSPEAQGENLMQGSESNFVIIHDLSKDFANKRGYDLVRELYTLVTRSREGSVINLDSSKFKHIINNIKLDKSNREDTVMSRDAVTEKKKERMSQLDKILNGWTGADSDPVFSVSEENESHSSPNAAPPVASGKSTKALTTTQTSSTETKPTNTTFSGESSADEESASFDDEEEVKIQNAVFSIPKVDYAPKAQKLAVDRDTPVVDIENQYNIPVYPGLQTNGVKRQLGFGLNKGKGLDYYDIALTANDEKLPTRFLDLNGLGKPGSAFSQRASAGLRLLQESVARADTINDVFDAIESSLINKRNIISFCRYLKPDLFGTEGVMSTDIDKYYQTAKEILTDCLSSQDCVAIMGYKFRSTIDQNSYADQSKAPKETDYLYRIVLRLKSELFGIDHCISLGNLPTIDSIRKYYDKSSLSDKRMRIDMYADMIRRLDQHLSAGKECVLLNTGLKLFTGERGAQTLFSIIDFRSLMKHLPPENNTRIDISRLVMNGYTIDPDPYFAPVLLRKDVVTFRPHRDMTADFTSAFGKDVKIPEGLIVYAETLASIIADNNGITNQDEVHKLITNLIWRFKDSFIKNGKFLAHNQVLAVVNTSGVTDYTVGNNYKYKLSRVPVLLSPSKKSMLQGVLSILHATVGKNSSITDIMKNMDSTSLARTMVTMLRRALNDRGELKYAIPDLERLAVTPVNGKNVPTVLKLFEKLRSELLKVDTKNKKNNSEAKDLHDLVIINELCSYLENGSITTWIEIEEFLTGISDLVNNNGPKINGQACYAFIRSFVKLGESAKKEGNKFSVDGGELVEMFTPKDEVFARLRPLSRSKDESWKSGSSMSLFGTPLNLVLRNGKPSGTRALKLVVDSSLADLGLGHSLSLVNTWVGPPQRFLDIETLIAQIRKKDDNGNDLVTEIVDFHEGEFGDGYNPDPEYVANFESESHNVPEPPFDWDINDYYARHMDSRLNTKYLIDSTYGDPIYGVTRIQFAEQAKSQKPVNGDTFINIQDGKTISKKVLDTNTNTRRIAYSSRTDGKVDKATWGHKLGDVVRLYNSDLLYRIVNIGKVAPNNTGASLSLAPITTDDLGRLWSDVYKDIQDGRYKGSVIVIDAANPIITQTVETYASSVADVYGDTQRKKLLSIATFNIEKAQQGLNITTYSERNGLMLGSDFIYIPDAFTEEQLKLPNILLWINDRESNGMYSKNFIWGNINQELLGDYTELDYLFVVVPTQKVTGVKEIIELTPIEATVDGKNITITSDSLFTHKSGLHFIKDPNDSNLLSDKNWVTYKEKNTTKTHHIATGQNVPGFNGKYITVKDDDGNNKNITISNIQSVTFLDSDTSRIPIETSIKQVVDSTDVKGRYVPQVELAMIVFNEEGLSRTVLELQDAHRNDAPGTFGYSIVRLSNKSLGQWASRVNGYEVVPGVLDVAGVHHDYRTWWKYAVTSDSMRMSMQEVENIFQLALLDGLNDVNIQSHLTIISDKQFATVRQMITNGEYEDFTTILRRKLHTFNSSGNLYTSADARNFAIVANISVVPSSEYKAYQQDTRTDDEKKQIVNSFLFKSDRGLIGQYKTMSDIPSYIKDLQQNRFNIVKKGNMYYVYVNIKYLQLNNLEFPHVSPLKAQDNIGKKIIKLNRYGLRQGRYEIDWVADITGLDSKLSNGTTTYNYRLANNIVKGNYNRIPAVNIDTVQYSELEYRILTEKEYEEFLKNNPYNKVGDNIEIEDSSTEGVSDITTESIISTEPQSSIETNSNVEEELPVVNSVSDSNKQVLDALTVNLDIVYKDERYTIIKINNDINKQSIIVINSNGSTQEISGDDLLLIVDVNYRNTQMNQYRTKIIPEKREYYRNENGEVGCAIKIFNTKALNGTVVVLYNDVDLEVIELSLDYNIPTNWKQITYEEYLNRYNEPSEIGATQLEAGNDTIPPRYLDRCKEYDSKQKIIINLLINKVESINGNWDLYDEIVNEFQNQLKAVNIEDAEDLIGDIFDLNEHNNC